MRQRARRFTYTQTSAPTSSTSCVSWRSQRGFSLLELLLVIAVIGIIVGISAPLAQRFQIKQDTRNSIVEIVRTMQLAQTRAATGYQDSSWGVLIDDTTITMFAGSSYAGRDTNLDETSPISGSLTISGDTEFVFTQQTGIPIRPGTMTITSLDTNTHDIVVTSQGTIEY